MGNLCYRFVIQAGILLLLFALLISPSQSLTCTSQKFKNKVFPNCSDLPHLSAHLHWNYDASNSTLAMAFVAPPAKPDGWVSWAINPTGTGMAGAQALLALKSNGTMTIQTYNITSYDLSKAGTKISYQVSDTSAENSDGTIKIFATWKLPEKTEKVNQVWQAGPGVSAQGYPEPHGSTKENLNAKGTLQLLGGASAASPSSPTSPSPSSTTSPSGPASSGAGASSNGMIVGFFFVLGSFIVL